MTTDRELRLEGALVAILQGNAIGNQWSPRTVRAMARHALGRQPARIKGGRFDEVAPVDFDKYLDEYVAGRKASQMCEYSDDGRYDR